MPPLANPDDRFLLPLLSALEAGSLAGSRDARLSTIEVLVVRGWMLYLPGRVTASGERIAALTRAGERELACWRRSVRASGS